MSISCIGLLRGVKYAMNGIKAPCIVQGGSIS